MEILSTHPFAIMLKAFNKLVENQPAVSKVEKQLLEIKESAKLSSDLNARQKEAVMERVDNYLKGDYYPRARPATKTGKE